MHNDSSYDSAIALIGMAGRFPGAPNIETFWQNIATGVTSIRVLTDEELLAAGVHPTRLAQPNYVKVGAPLDNIAGFDAAFFGYTPREAELMDPQHRLFLECAWEALEQAGYDPYTYHGQIGVFAGSAFSTYYLYNLSPDKDLVEAVGQLQIDAGNDRDSLASTVSYKLNLKGPALGVQTFCSTSLVAVHLACQSLLNYESDIALAGGVSLLLPHGQGYVYEEGGILSPDGQCRAFDRQAQGSVVGSGSGVVVLKRLREALEDGDEIVAVLRGSAINNDGSLRVSYTAPGVDGQANVILGALSYAGVSAESISYIEAHGTGTKLGDAVELAAMRKAFAAHTRAPAVLCHRLGETERRPPGSRIGGHRVDQSQSGPQAQATAAERAFCRSQRRERAGRESLLCEHALAGVAVWARATTSRRQFFRLRGN